MVLRRFARLILCAQLCHYVFAVLSIGTAWASPPRASDDGLEASRLTYSHPQQYVATNWRTEEGLPQNSVTAMIQDHQGYLWIGTFGGLARFDGHRFVGTTTLGIAAGRILSLFESRTGELWLGTVDSGIVRLKDGDAKLKVDGLPSQFIASIHEDLEGGVWINTPKGITRDIAGRLQPYASHQGRPVNEFCLQERSGSMWFRSAADVVRFDAGGSIDSLTVHDWNFTSVLIHEDSNGRVWIVLPELYRLVRYHRGTFSDVPLPPLERHEVPNPSRLIGMAKDARGDLVVMTPAGFLRIVDGQVGELEEVRWPGDANERPNIRSFLVDRENNRWVGTARSGLIRFRPAPLTAYGKEEGLSNASFRVVLQDREGRMWFAGDSVYSLDDAGFHLLPGVANIRAITETRQGVLWFGGYGGLHRWDEGAMTALEVDAPAVNVIHEGADGTLWIGAILEDKPGGLFRLRDGTMERIPGFSDVRDILDDGSGGLWLGGLQGLWHMRDGKTVLHDEREGLSSNAVYDIEKDSDGTLWIATYGGGLNRFRNGRFTAITTRDGLPNDMVVSILNDGAGNLWVGSNQNIFRFSLEDLNAFADGRTSSMIPVSYGVSEGMRSSECNSGNPARWRTTDGRLWFPTLEGVVAVYPNAVDHRPPPVVIEAAGAGDVSLLQHGRTPAPPGNNTFDFNFTALSFSSPDKVRFKYQLSPFDKKFVNAGTRRTAHYMNMPPGRYSFHVMAANSYGVWNEEGASVQFELRPHFYQTWWFRLALFGAVMSSAGGIYWLRLRNLRARQLELERLVDSRTAELRDEIRAREEAQAALRHAHAELAVRSTALEASNRELEAFAYSVSHDLRAPLRHLAGFAELLRKGATDSLPGKSTHYIAMIVEAANRMGTLIDDLLAFSRISRVEAQHSAVNLGQLVQEAIEEVRQGANDRVIEWDVHELPMCYGDRSMLRMVLVNLISNAVKFTGTREEAHIEIGCSDSGDDRAVLFVKDNGVGFDMRYYNKLFGVFQRLHPREAFEGTGIGLATVQRIVHRHGGRVWAESILNQGATFYVSLSKVNGG